MRGGGLKKCMSGRGYKRSLALTGEGGVERVCRSLVLTEVWEGGKWSGGMREHVDLYF